MEAEYNVRLLHPERERFHERGRKLSLEAYRSLPVTRDIRYGKGKRALLDFFAATNPASPVGVPVLAFFHGGYWHAHERSEFAFVARSFASAGIATAIVGYDLAPAVRLAQIVAQARAAVAWLHAHAADLGFDRRLMFVGGHSAGAHLAACVLTGRDSPCRGGLMVSGIYELSPLIATTLNRPLALTPSMARRWSPLRHPLPDSGRIVVAVGAFETTEFIRQSHDFARAWDGGGRAAEVMIVPASNHYSVVLELADADSALAREARQLVTRQVMRDRGRGHRVAVA
jgi:arylformamidase